MMPHDEIVRLNNIALIVESIIFIILLGLIVLIIRSYFLKRTPLILILIRIFIFYGIGFLFLVIARATYYSLGVEFMDQFSFMGWWLFRIGYYRPSFIFIAIGSFYSYRLRVAIFQKQENRTERIVMTVILTIISAYFLFGFDARNSIYDFIAFFLLFAYVFVINIRFMIGALKLLIRIDEPKYRQGIIALTIMAISFCMLFFFYMMDRVMVVLTGNYFSVFFYLGEIMILVAFVSAYLGYIRPGQKG